MNDFVELRTIFAMLLRRWWLLLASALLFGAAGYLYSIRQMPVYQATTSLIVGSPIQDTNLNRNDLQVSQQLALTYADIARRQPVMQNTIENLQLPIGWSQLRGRVRAQLVGDTQLLELKVEASTPAEAQLIADEVARQLVSISPSGKQRDQAEDEFARNRLFVLRDKIEKAQMQIEQLEGDLINSIGISANAVAVEEQIVALEGLIARWESNYAQLLSSLNEGRAVNDLTVLENALASAKPIRPRTGTNTLIAALFGLGLAVGLVLLKEFLDDTLKTADDVTRALSLATVGAITRVNGQGYQERLIIDLDPFSVASEGYRMLRSKIQFASVDHGDNAIMITSASDDEGKSLCVANLGIVMAQAGLRTVIVDANLRAPSQHEIFKLSNQDGLTSLLYSREEEYDRYLRSTMVPNLKVLVSGPVPSNPSELLGSPRMQQFLDSLRSQVDVILCDSTEAVTVADSSVLSRKVDVVIMVVSAGDTSRELVVRALNNLYDAGANVTGVVLNRVTDRQRKQIVSSTTTTAASTPLNPISEQQPA